MSKVWLWLAYTALAPAVGETYDVWQLSGTDEAFEAVMQAARVCHYNDVHEVIGGQLGVSLQIVIPTQQNAQYECLRQWLKEHKEFGFGVPPASKR